jgi:arylsulfatase B
MDAANDHWQQTYDAACLDAKGNPTLTDFWDTEEPAKGQNNSWACSQANQGGANCTWEDDKLQARLLATIAAHNASEPLFLFWSAHTVHEPYEVPNADLAKFASIDVEVRKYYAAMVDHLDGLVPAVVDALKAKGMWDNLLFAVTSDNGGPLAKTPVGLVDTSGANNYPLRGGKIGIMEGGIRLNAFISGGVVPAALRGSTHEGWMHLEDFYTTFCSLAGVDPTDARAAAAGLPPVEGLDMSAMLLANASSPRTEIVIGSSDGSDHEGNTYVAGIISDDGWKLIIAPSIDPAFYQGPVFPNTSTTAQPHLKCGDPAGIGAAKGPGCLFNVLSDPYELDDRAAVNTAKVAQLRARIAALQKTVYSPNRGPHDKTMCTAGINRHGGFLGPWLP